MSYIIVPANRRRQPQAFVGVNPNYSSAYVIDCGKKVIVNRGIRADVTAHDASIGAGSEGLAHAYVDNKTFDYAIPSVTIGTGDFTIASYFYQIASVNSYQYVGGTDAVAIAPFVYHTSASNHAGVYVVSVLVDSGYTLGGGLHRMVVRRIGGQVYFNIDNLPRTNVANSTSIGALSKIIVGSYTAGGAYGLYSGSFNYIYALDVTRGWSETEARRFVDNPWCVFAKEPRIIYFGAGGTGATTNGVGSSTGTSTVLATSEALKEAIGSITGVSTVLATGQSLWEALGQITGSSTVSGSGISLWDTIGSSTGTTLVTAVGQSLFDALGQAAGVSTVTGVDGSILVSGSTTGSSAGSSIVSGVGISLWDSTGVSSGLASVTAILEAFFEATGSSVGTSNVSGVGSTPSTGTGTLDQATIDAIAVAVWAQILEAGLSAEGLMRILVAHAAGSATGLENGSPVFKSLDGTKDRITGTYVTGTRNVTSRDAS